MFIVLDEGGMYTGVFYPQINKEITDHHEGFGEYLFQVEELPTNVGTEDDPAYIPFPMLQVKADRIVNYLEDYLNKKAVDYGYNDYHSAMIYVNSSFPKFKREGQAFFECADAIWSYVENNRESYLTTGQPDLATVKFSHPKLEDFLT